MIDTIFSISSSIRYVAIYQNGKLETRSKSGISNSSSDDSDFYEEILVNPTLLQLSSQRGNIDCGGLDYLIIKYGHFFQWVYQTNYGHVSVCIESKAKPIEIGNQIM